MKKIFLTSLLLLFMTACGSTSQTSPPQQTPTFTPILVLTSTQTQAPQPTLTLVPTIEPTPTGPQKITTGILSRGLTYEFFEQNTISHADRILLNDSFLNDPAKQKFAKEYSYQVPIQIGSSSNPEGTVISLIGTVGKNMWPHYATYETDTELYLITWEVIAKNPSGEGNIITSITTAHNILYMDFIKYAQAQLYHISLSDMRVFNLLLKTSIKSYGPPIDELLLNDDSGRNDLYNGIFSEDATDTPVLCTRVD